MADSSIPSRTVRLTSVPRNSACADTPGWTTRSLFGETVGCSGAGVGCFSADAKQNCCKCKKECCGKCGDDFSDWDTMTCGLNTLPPALAPAPRPTSPPSDDTTCLCSRSTYIHGQTINEQYAKSCPNEIVSNWPYDCDKCCAYVSSGQSMFLLLFLLLVPMLYCAIKLFCRGRGTDEVEGGDNGTAHVTAPAYPVEESAPASSAPAYSVMPAYNPAAGSALEPANAYQVPLLANDNAEKERFASLLAK